jgi:hypothetical protein
MEAQMRFLLDEMQQLREELAEHEKEDDRE